MMLRVRSGNTPDFVRRLAKAMKLCTIPQPLELDTHCMSPASMSFRVALHCYFASLVNDSLACVNLSGTTRLPDRIAQADSSAKVGHTSDAEGVEDLL